MATSAPLSASARAIAAPMPREAPVTSARLPVSSVIFVLSVLIGAEGFGRTTIASARLGELALHVEDIHRVVHLVEAAVPDLVEGELGVLHRHAGGRQAEPRLDRRPDVEEAAGDLVALDGQVDGPPDEVGHSGDMTFELRDNIVAGDALAVLDQLVMDELGHAAHL